MSQFSELRQLQDRFIELWSKKGVSDGTVICYEQHITLGDLRTNLYPRLKWAISVALRPSK
jgi:hypothetical protein